VEVIFVSLLVAVSLATTGVAGFVVYALFRGR